MTIGTSDRPANEFKIETVDRIAEIDAPTWNACADPKTATNAGSVQNPFVSHAFLNALEESGSATPATGWAPCHAVLRNSTGDVDGVMPLYLKSHSYGEYVFDYGWADAFSRAGGRYYPKLQCSVPFTPATGPRLLVRDAQQNEFIGRLLAHGLEALTNRFDVSSAHLTFLPHEQWKLLGSQDFLLRKDQQFHWLNEGYQTFDDFLAALTSRKRKNLRKERDNVRKSGICIEWLTGSALTESHWDEFFRFYIETGARKWGRPYLTRQFFSFVGEALPEQTLLIMAKRNQRYIAGALNFIGGDTLFGRNWGCIEYHPFLHFELCYYQAVDFAIARGLRRVEAGAQGAHKLARGYVPTPTYSAHYVPDPAFRRALDDYLKQERSYVSEEIEAMKRHTPFRRNAS